MTGSSPAESRGHVVYEGPMSKALVRLKRFSLTGCMCSFATPLLLIENAAGANVANTVLQTSTAVSHTPVPFAAKVVVTVSVVGFSVGSTLLLNWLMRPYVGKVSTVPNSNSIEIERYDFLGRSIREIVSKDEVQKADSIRPFVNYRAGNRAYYLHEDFNTILARHK